jgi:hypothetical protein
MGHQYYMPSYKEVDDTDYPPYKKINKSNQKYSTLVSKFLTKQYCPIDWHVDIKSGYRWSERIHSSRIKFGNTPGVDVKIPWELSRFHHLVHLAIDSIEFSENKGEKLENQNEFQNQVLDFIANNPPRFGVNWVCSMDVAIRISNILLAYDIFRSVNCTFSASFENILVNSIYDHASHIMNNLEWYPGNIRNNHYLSDIMGILFCTSHLEKSELTDAWHTFAASELVNEVNYQFYDEGTNFEGSTCYHRLSTELVLWGTLIIQGTKDRIVDINCNKILKKIYIKNKRNQSILSSSMKDLLSEAYYLKIYKMFKFLEDIEVGNGTIPQIGDNDSGRLFKISPKYSIYTVDTVKSTFENLRSYTELDNKASYWQENHLDVTPLLSLIYLLFTINIRNSNDSTRIRSKTNDFIIANSYNRNTHIVIDYSAHNRSIINTIPFKEIVGNTNNLLNKKLFFSKKQRFEISNKNYIQNLNIIKYCEFGVYIFKASGFYLLIRALKNAPIAPSHFHYDQLSIELHVDGDPILRDPGSYTYTADPKQRNLYRSDSAHNNPFFLKELNSTLSEKKVFSKIDHISCDILHFSEFGFYGQMNYKGSTRSRLIILNEYYIEIIDMGDSDETGHVLNAKIQLPYSPGYGILAKTFYD